MKGGKLGRMSGNEERILRGSEGKKKREIRGIERK